MKSLDNALSMAEKDLEAMKTPGFTASASGAVIDEVRSYTSTLVDGATVLAEVDGLDAVSARHVRRAAAIARPRARLGWRESAKVFGSLLLGAFIPEFLRASQADATQIDAPWIAAGIIGAVLLTYGLTRGG